MYTFCLENLKRTAHMKHLGSDDRQHNRLLVAAKRGGCTRRQNLGGIGDAGATKNIIWRILICIDVLTSDLYPRPI